MVMFNGFTLGSAAGGVIAAELIPTLGWQSVFIAGGVLPLVLTPIIWFLLPESLRFQVMNKAPRERVARTVRRLAPDMAMTAETEFVVEETHAKRMSVRALLADGRARRTILLWIVFFMSLLDIYLLVSWLPTTMDQAGASPQTAIYLGITLQLGAFLGSPGLGWVLDRWGPRGSMFPAYAIAAVCIALIGIFATQSIPLTFLVVFLAGFGVIGGQTAANAVAAISYPTEIRSTGVGWCLGVGRIGSIVGPALAGVLLSMNVSTRDIFLLSAIPAAIGALAALGLGGRSERPASEAVSLAH
jgi:AAHS family 4-hydroxybenzoate transporter-like MFS transporter